MPDLEVNVFNQKLKLSYKENEKQRIIKAVEILNNNWNKLSHLHGKVSDLKIVTLISLEIQDSIEDVKFLKDKLNIQDVNNELLKIEIESKKKECKENIEIINQLKTELNNKNQELSKIEDVLDEFQTELLQIKNKILKQNHE